LYLTQENDDDVKPYGAGNGSSVAGVETAKKREHDASNLEKVLHYLGTHTHTHAAMGELSVSLCLVHSVIKVKGAYT